MFGSEVNLVTPTPIVTTPGSTTTRELFSLESVPANDDVIHPTKHLIGQWKGTGRVSQQIWIADTARAHAQRNVTLNKFNRAGNNLLYH